LATLGNFSATRGTVNLTGTLNNAGATLPLAPALGTWVLHGGTILGGTIASSGGSKLELSDYAGTLAGVTIAAGLTVDSLTVRYEDLVSDLPGQALRLSAWLDVDLDPIGALANTNGLSHHRTSETGDASIGRWRRDLSTEVSDRIEGELGPYFDRFGYARRSAGGIGPGDRPHLPPTTSARLRRE